MGKFSGVAAIIRAVAGRIHRPRMAHLEYVDDEVAQLEQEEADAHSLTWRAALDDPALIAPAVKPALLARAQAAIDTHPSIQRHGSSGEPLQPDMLARVSDFIGRMANNPLGCYYLRNLSVRSMRNLIDEPPGRLHDEVGDALVDKLVQHCFDGRREYTGDGYVALALITAELATAHKISTCGDLSGMVLGPPGAAAAGWESCADCSWVVETPTTPWVVHRRTDGVSMCSAGSCVGTVLSHDAHKRTPSATIVNHVLRMPRVDRTEVFALKDSARIVAPHAAHSKARGGHSTTYVRNLLLIGRDVVHADGRPNVSVVAMGDGELGSAVPQKTLLKLLLPPGLNTSELDARFSYGWR